MKKVFVVLGLSMLVFSSCETTPSTNTDTERFYQSSWNVEMNRSHNAVGTLPAADEDHTGTATLTKSGSFTYDIAALNNHMYQYWGYSWSTDHFYMNWEPCIDWHMNEAEDSLFLHYNHYDYDPSSGNSFYWDYKVVLTK